MTDLALSRASSTTKFEPDYGTIYLIAARGRPLFTMRLHSSILDWIAHAGEVEQHRAWRT